MQPLTHPFPPIIDEHTRVLFLGSFPSIASFEKSFYYAHPRNAFWPILEKIFNVTLTTKEAKKKFCLEKGIGLWDVIGSCERSNSSDANLRNCMTNDFETLLKTYPNIKAFGFTGKTSFDLFRKKYRGLEVVQILLPSTSPAHAAMKKEEKTTVYKKFLDTYLTV